MDIKRAGCVMKRMAAPALILAASTAAALPGQEATRLSFTVPSADVVAGEDMRGTGWPMRLATPSAEGQFEVLVKKAASPVLAPRCHSAFLVVRMPASIAIGDSTETRQAVARKQQAYAALMAARAASRPIRFDVFAGPYGHKRGGTLELTGCNLFFVEPPAKDR